MGNGISSDYFRHIPAEIGPRPCRGRGQPGRGRSRSGRRRPGRRRSRCPPRSRRPQRRSVVDAVADEPHRVPGFPRRGHEPHLVHRGDGGEDRVPHRQPAQLLVVGCLDLRPSTTSPTGIPASAATCAATCRLSPVKILTVTPCRGIRPAPTWSRPPRCNHQAARASALRRRPSCRGQLDRRGAMRTT